MLQLILQVLINGLVLGLLYVLVASGLTLIFGISRVFNFAHGELYMLGGFALYYLFQEAGINYFVALFLTMLLLGALGILLERVFFRPLRGQMTTSMVMSLGLTMILSAGAFLIFGGEVRAVESPFKGILTAGGVRIPVERLAIIVGAIVLMLGLNLFLRRSKYGLAVRAVSQDEESASVRGISVNSIQALSFGISAALAGAAGGLGASVFGVDPFRGFWAVIKAAIVIILGGMGSLAGAVVGGLALGLVESFASTFIGSKAEFIGFVMILIIMLVRPRGLLGRD